MTMTMTNCTRTKRIKIIKDSFKLIVSKIKIINGNEELIENKSDFESYKSAFRFGINYLTT